MPDTYSQSPLTKKLAVKPPQWYREWLGDLPEGATYTEGLEGMFDWIQVFVKTKAELERWLPEIKSKLQPGNILWISFPRAKKATDLNRNSLMELPERYGLQVVANVVVNEEWTAYRVKQTKE
jgi:hypothetical protein